MAENSKPTAAAAILMDTLGNVLLFARWGNAANLGLPAGLIDPGEDAETAARRELFEETGLTAIGALEPYYISESGGNLCQAFIVNDWSGDISPGDEEGFAFWGRPEQLLGADCEFRDFNQGWMAKMGLIA